MENKAYQADPSEGSSSSLSEDRNSVKYETIDYSNVRVGFQVAAGVAAAIGAFILGTQLGWSSPAQPQLQPSNNRTNNLILNDDEMSWVASLVTLGALIGGLTGGALIDTFGRKFVLIILSIPFLAGWLLIAYGVNVAMLYAGRIIGGLAGGVVSVATNTYVGEISIPSIRGTLGSFFQLFVCLGILATNAAGLVLSWRWLAGAAAFFPVVFVIAMLFVPETPYYLVKKGRRNEACASLRRLRGPNFNIEPELAELEKLVMDAKEQKVRFTDVFSKWAIKPLFVALGLMFFQQVSGINAAVFYTAKIFESAGSTLDGVVSSTIIGGVQVGATMFSSVLVDRLGRRILLLASKLFMAISMAGLGAYFYIQKNDPSTAETLGWLPLVCLIVFIAFFAFGFGPLPWLMLGEVLPTSVKGPASSLATFLNWFLAFIVTKTFVDIQKGLTEAGSFWLFAGFCILGLLFVWFAVPETKNKTPEEIQAFFGNHHTISHNIPRENSSASTDKA